ncbi:MAG: hypothetical protein IJE92_01815, partial [Clostridia bacterium]|nr:hypothetical protein [Clostridia bacterium]
MDAINWAKRYKLASTNNNYYYTIGSNHTRVVPFFDGRKSLQKLGKKARLLFSWDEFDRLRKVPTNVQEVTTGFEQHIGKPYTSVPNPFDDEFDSYASHFENEFE